MRACTGLNSDFSTRFQLFVPGLDPMMSRELGQPNNLTITVNTVDVQNTFCNVDSDSSDLPYGHLLIL